MRKAHSKSHDAKKGTQHVGIFFNEKDQKYIVQPMARHPIGASADYGKPTIVLNAQFEESIVSATLDNLSRYDAETYKKESAPKRSGREQRDFVKAHLQVFVTKDTSGDMWIYPMRRSKGGYAATGEKIIASASQISEVLPSVLRDAFSKSS